MTAFGPAPKFEIEIMTCLCECSLRCDRAVVVGPSTNNGIEVFDQYVLRKRTMVVDDGRHLLGEACKGIVAGFDDGFEAKWPPLPRFASVCFADGILAYCEAEEFKAYVSVVSVKRVRDPRFAWLQFQSHACEPCCCDVLYPLNNRLVRMQDDIPVGSGACRQFPDGA